jgi:hypothetical protein
LILTPCLLLSLFNSLSLSASAVSHSPASRPPPSPHADAHVRGSSHFCPPDTSTMCPQQSQVPDVTVPVFSGSVLPLEEQESATAIAAMAKRTFEVYVLLSARER